LIIRVQGDALCASITLGSDFDGGQIQRPVVPFWAQTHSVDAKVMLHNPKRDFDGVADG
jgi:hypothetical protein